MSDGDTLKRRVGHIIDMLITIGLLVLLAFSSRETEKQKGLLESFQREAIEKGHATYVQGDFKWKETHND